MTDSNDQPPANKTKATTGANVQQGPEDGRTVIAPKGAARGGNKTNLTPSHSKSNSQPPPKPPPQKLATSISQLKQQALTPDQQAELTRIGHAMRDQNSRGFVVAQNAANKALAENKIILNKRFVLESTLGAGGMGTVYKARDLRKIEANDLNPFVAIKVLNDEFKNHPDAFVTLQREASRSHTLSHPNIVTVHDFDRDGDIYYMTMELLDGVGLESVIRKYRDKGIPIKHALPIIRDFCQGLIHAHQKHIIHSDLKPGNLFVSKNGTKVLDFGIARISSQAANAKDFDAGSLGALTPNYASLEMIQNQEPHPSDDVFAAAIIAYELFTGRHPYNKTPADIALQNGLKPEKIKTLSKRQWRALEKGLKLERRHRTQTMQALYDGLTEKRKFPIFKVSSAVFLVVIGGFVYKQFFGPNQVDVLANETFNKAQNCYQQQDYECAVDSTKAVLKMKPQHAEGQALLVKAEDALQNQTVQAILKTFNGCLSEQGDEQCARNQLEALKQNTQDAATIENAEHKLKQFLADAQYHTYVEKAQSCMNDADFKCTVEYAQLALSIREQDSVAQQLMDGATTKLDQQAAEQQQTMAHYQTLLTKAMACLGKKDYACVEQNAQAAMALPVGNKAEANTLLQNAVFAKQQAEQNLTKAKGILQKGQACFDKKNYSCAIANSESALEFVPDYAPAVQLRNKAKQEIQKLKNQIQIN